MIFTPALIGIGGKILSNVVNSLFANAAEKERHLRNQDATVIKAQVELAKEANKSVIGQLNRVLMFNMLIASWCYIGIYMFTKGSNEMHSILLPKDGWFSMWEVRKVSGAFLGYQWFLVVEMVVGFVCVPSRRR